MNAENTKELEKIKEQIALLITGLSEIQDDEKIYLDAFLDDHESMKCEQRIDNLEHIILYLSDAEALTYNTILL